MEMGAKKQEIFSGNKNLEILMPIIDLNIYKYYYIIAEVLRKKKSSTLWLL